MGGKKSRDKGKRGELEFAALCREHGFDCHRTAQYCGKTGQAADVKGLPGIHAEVKRCETLKVWDFMLQAERDSNPGEIPIVAWRRNNHRWLIIMEANDWFKLYSEYFGGVQNQEETSE